MQLFDEALAKGSYILGYNGAQEKAYCEAFTAMMGGGYADGVCSGTNALYIALRSLELEPFTEVIVPPITDAGGSMPVALCNLIPVAADSAPGSFNTSVEQIAARLTARTRAIVIAHVAGIPVDMDPILALAKERDLRVVEDCAQCHGATYKGKVLGSLGDVAAFSTMFGKIHATGGQGGVVFTKDEARYWKIRQHADRGKPFGVSLSNTVGAGVGAAASLGGNLLAALNSNMDEIHACIGRVQIQKLPGFLDKRRAIANRIAHGISETAGIRLLGDPPFGRNANWFLIFHFDSTQYAVNKAEFVAALKAEGLPFEASYWFAPSHMPWHSNGHAFGDGSSHVPWSNAATHPQDWPLPNARATDETHFRIVIHEGWGDEEISDSIAIIRKVDEAFRIRDMTVNA